MGPAGILRAPDPAGEDRRAEDEAVLAAGLDWAHAVLAGGDHAACRAAFEERRRALLAADCPSRLDRLSAAFALAPADEDVLLFCLAHRTDGAFPGLCAAAAGDLRQSFVTAHLLATTVGGGDRAFARTLLMRLSPDGPLRRHGLVEMAETHALAAIAVDEAVTRRLLGEEGAGAAALSLAPVPRPLPLGRLVDLGHAVERRLARGRAAVALVGPAASGREAVAVAAAEAACLVPVRLALAAVPPAGDRRRAFLAALAREAALDRLCILVDADADEASPEEAARGAAAAERLEALCAALPGRLVLLARTATGLPAAVSVERLPRLSVPERAALWRAALAPAAPERLAEADRVAAQFPLGPREIAGLARTLGEAACPGELWQRCRTGAAGDLEGLADRLAPRFTFEDLVLPEALIAELRAIADQVRHRTLVLDGWGFSRRLGGGQGTTALFAGPSGTGKSMAAEVIAGDLGLDLYRVDLSRLVSKWIGETEKNLARVFDAAEASGACLFFDEADACLGKRSEVKDSHDRHANMEVSYLLQRMERYEGVCLMATNLKNNLDAAFLRRLRFIVDFPFPDQGLRRRIWERAFPPETPVEGLDLAALARLDIAGGSIVVIAVNAAFLAAAEGGPVTMERIARAARGEFRKHDKTFRATW